MISVRLIERRGPVLTPSALACLSGVPTVNISGGCAHRCIYCYTRGYSQYPGEGHVLVYRDTATRVTQELGRKRKRLAAVYFCPSCDAFQPVDAVLDQSYATMTGILKAGVGVEFVTKGAVPDRFIHLFAKHRGMISAQIGLTTLDGRLTSILEPGAAPVAERLAAIRRLRQVGVRVSVRADPLIHGVTDSDRYVRALMAACRARGVTDLAVSYLFLRPAITASLRRHVTDGALLERILTPYAAGERFTLRGGEGGGVALPAAVRRQAFARFRATGPEYGVAVRVCGCKNPDLSADRCHLTRAASPHRTARSSQGLLWQSGTPSEG